MNLTLTFDLSNTSIAKKTFENIQILFLTNCDAPFRSDIGSFNHFDNYMQNSCSTLSHPYCFKNQNSNVMPFVVISSIKN